MSVTKDGDTGRWMSQIRVTDWTGKTIHKKKRGFATKKEALQWERDFISQVKLMNETVIEELSSLHKELGKVHLNDDSEEEIDRKSVV